MPKVDNVMRYIYEEGEYIKVKLDQEALTVAMQLANGAEYGQFDIDPYEAAILISFIKDFAIDTNNKELYQSCETAQNKMRVHVDAFSVIVSKTKEE